MTDTQARRIFDLLWRNEWVATWRLPKEENIMQYNARINKLRHWGCDIRACQINGVDGFKLVNKHEIDPNTMRPRSTPVGETMNLFSREVKA